MGRGLSTFAVALVRGPTVAPRGSLNNEPCPPLGLAYLAAALREAGFPVRAIDAAGEALDRVSPIPGTRLQYNGLSAEEILALVPDDVRLIGVSSMFSHEWLHDRALISALKRAFPRALLVAGGEHATALADYLLADCPELDACALGEGEATIVELAEALSAGRGLDAVAGLVRRGPDGRPLRAGPRPRLRELDVLPWPAWDLLPLGNYLDRQLGFGPGFGRNLPLMVSRGCPYECTFCSSPSMWTTRYGLRGVDDVMAEIAAHKERYAITGLQLYDLTAVIRKDWILEFCRRLIDARLDLDWSLPSGTRSEALDEETLDLLARSGCRYLVYAPESGSARTLELIKKKISLPRLRRSVRAAVGRGIAVRSNLILGFPHETRGDLWKTVALQARFAWDGVEDCPLYPFQPYPGSELFARLRSSGALSLDDRYFETLASLSTGRFALPDASFCRGVGRWELHVTRVLGFVGFYLLAYLLRPWRAARTVRQIFTGRRASSVLEQRLRDRWRRLRAAASRA